MSRATHIAFEPVDESDPTLAVDDLVDFLTARTDPEDPMLAVTGLEELFSARPNDDLEPFATRETTAKSRMSFGPRFVALPWSFSTSPKRSTPSRANAIIEGPIKTQ